MYTQNGSLYLAAYQAQPRYRSAGTFDVNNECPYYVSDINVPAGHCTTCGTLTPNSELVVTLVNRMY